MPCPTGQRPGALCNPPSALTAPAQPTPSRCSIARKLPARPTDWSGGRTRTSLRKACKKAPTPRCSPRRQRARGDLRSQEATPEPMVTDGLTMARKSQPHALQWRRIKRGGSKRKDVFRGTTGGGACGLTLSHNHRLLAGPSCERLGGAVGRRARYDEMEFALRLF